MAPVLWLVRLTGHQRYAVGLL